MPKRPFEPLYNLQDNCCLHHLVPSTFPIAFLAHSGWRRPKMAVSHAVAVVFQSFSGCGACTGIGSSDRERLLRLSVLAYNGTRVYNRVVG